MSQRVSIELDEDRRSLQLVVHERDWHGRTARIRVLHRAQVKRSGGVDVEQPLHEETLALAPLTTVALRAPLAGYPHEGEDLALAHVLAIEIDDGVLFDSKLELPIPVPAPRRAPAQGDAARWIEPRDRWSLLANLRALAPDKRVKAIAMCVVCSLLIGVNMLVGWHDQWVPESQTWFYDHHGTKKGRRTSESPLVKAATGSGAIGAGAFATLLALLRSYMQFELRHKELPRRGARVNAGDLVRGRSRVALEDVEVRVVAANREYGLVRVKQKKKVVHRRFHAPFRAVCLYSQRLAQVPANAPLESYLAGEVAFERVYRELLPPTQLQGTHGIDLVWEVQLLHPQYVDQEAQGTAAGLRAGDFDP